MTNCPFQNPNQKNSELPDLKVFRLHPAGIRLEKAHHKLKGTANPDAVKWCGPFIHVNALGWWVYPPMDLEVMYKGDNEWDYKILYDYEQLEQPLIQASLRPEDKFRDTARSRYAFGASEPDTLQIWTGCILKTPPGWGIHVRTPINFPEAYARPYHIQEGIIESSWLTYDIWLNIKFHRTKEKVIISRDMQVPLAQFVPIKKEAYDPKISLTDRLMDSSDEECKPIWDGWQDYNFKKWKAQGEKDPLTYHKERKQHGRD